MKTFGFEDKGMKRYKCKYLELAQTRAFNLNAYFEIIYNLLKVFQFWNIEYLKIKQNANK